MQLLRSLASIFEPNHEIGPAAYYSEFLKRDDALQLMRFMDYFPETLPIPCAIMAVGSSTFPSRFWENRRRLNLNQPGLDAKESYGDIDLLILPEEITPLDELKDAVGETLTALGLEFKPHKDTLMGVRYGKGSSCGKDGTWRKEILPFMDIDYGLHSLSTKFSNGTGLDLILGRDDMMNKTASQKISDERDHNYSFCILHRQHASLVVSE